MDPWVLVDEVVSVAKRSRSRPYETLHSSREGAAGIITKPSYKHNQPITRASRRAQ